MAKKGALKSVYIVNDDELRVNGGRWLLQSGPAIRVRGFTADTLGDRKVTGGDALPIYVLGENDIRANGGQFLLKGGQPISVTSAIATARGVIQGKAIPVWPVDDNGNYDADFAGGYSSRVIATNPIAYWILGEAVGATAVDQINSPAQDGTYANVTLAQPGIGDGNTAALFNGVNSQVDVFSLALQGVYGYTAGSLQIWNRVLNVGIWTDGTSDFAVAFGADGANRMTGNKVAAVNRYDVRHRGGGSFDGVSITPIVTTDWFAIHLTWDEVGNVTLVYMDGAVQGAPAPAAAFVGVLNAARCVIGDFVIPSNEPWNGYAAHVALWDRVLTPAEVLSLGIV